MQDGKTNRLSVNTKGPLTVGKIAVNGTSKAPARANSADAADGSADTGEYTFGFEQKEMRVSYRYTYHFLQDLTCTYPEDAYTDVQYSYSTSSANISLVQDVNNVLGYGEGRIYICNSNSGREGGTIIITAELRNGEEVVAADSYTVNIIIDFGFSEVSATATFGKPFTAPTLTNIYGTSVTYSVGNTDIATIDEKTGEVTPVSQGYTTIYATLDADNSITASYSLAVNYPSVSLPYNESFAEGRGEFNITNKNLGDGLTDVWAHDGGNQCMTATGKADGNNKTSESWLVSPSIYIYYNGTDKTYLTFEQAVDNGFGDIAGEATLWVREIGGEWQNVAIAYPEAPADGSLSGFGAQAIDLTAYFSEGSEHTIQFAFKYTSSADVAGTWSVRNVSAETKQKTFAFSPKEVTVHLGEEFTAPTLTNDYGGTVVYISENESVATVDENGVVTIVGPGQTYIYAILEEAGRETYYTLTVIDPSSSSVGLPYEESFNDGKGRFYIDDVALGEGLTDVWTHDGDNQCMTATGKADGNNKVSESWLISPVIEELTDAEQKYTISFEQAVDNRFGNLDGETTLWVREEGGEWEPLAIGHPTAPEDGTLSEFETQTVNVLKYVGTKIQIGFRYTSSTDAAGTWCIRNVSVNGMQMTFDFSATEAAATIGEEFTPPTLINDYEGYEVRYRSRSTSIATVDETTGEVTLVKKGSTLIYATLYDGDYQVRETFYKLTVSGDPVVTLPYVENFEASIGLFSIENQKTAGGRSSVWSYKKSNQVMRAAPFTIGGDPDFVMESWLVSPIINAETDESILFLSFDHAVQRAFGDIATEATLWVREVGGEWSLLEIVYPVVEAGFITQVADLSAYIGKKIQIGFKYVGSVAEGGIWDIKNVQVSTDHREVSNIFAFPTDYVEATIGEEFSAPKLINTCEGTVFYFSENENVAMIDENTGAVTLVGPGETTIAAILDAEEYMDAYYVLAVTGEPLAYYKKVTSADELTDGGTYVVLNEENRKAMALVGNSNSASVMGADVYAGKGECRVSGFVDIVIEQQPDGSYALRNRNGYVGCNPDAGFAPETGDASEAGCLWTVGFTAQGDAEIQNVASAGRYIRFDATESVFRPYTSGDGAAVQLYEKIDVIEAGDMNGSVDFRAVGNDGMFYATFSNTDNVLIPADENIEVQTVTVSNSRMTLKDVEKSLYVVTGNYSTLSYGYYVPKGSGVLLRSTQETVPYHFVSEEKPGKALDADNMLRGVDGDGLFEAEEGYRYYKLAYDDYEKKTDLGFYYGAPDGGAFEMRAGLAYLAVPESALSQTSEAAATHFIFGGDGDVTTIRDIEAEKRAKETVIYNTAGQRVNAVGQPGVYIVNGRKVVVK